MTVRFIPPCSRPSPPRTENLLPRKRGAAETSFYFGVRGENDTKDCISLIERGGGVRMGRTGYFSLSAAHAIKPTPNGGIKLYKKITLPGTIHSVSVKHRPWFGRRLDDEIFFSNDERSYGVTFNIKALACVGTEYVVKPKKRPNITNSLLAAGFVDQGDGLWHHRRIKTVVVQPHGDGSVTVLRQLACPLLPTFSGPLTAVVQGQMEGRPCHYLHMSARNGTRLEIAIADEPLTTNVEGIVAAGYVDRPVPWLPLGIHWRTTEKRNYNFN